MVKSRCGLVFILLISGLLPTPLMALPQEESKQALVTKAVAPVFSPIVALVMKNGEVLIEVEIAPNGDVIKATIIDGDELRGINNANQFINPIINTAKSWQFAPEKNMKINRVVRLTFVYKIVPETTRDTDLTPIFTFPYKVEVRTNKQYKLEKIMDVTDY